MYGEYDINFELFDDFLFFKINKLWGFGGGGGGCKYMYFVGKKMSFIGR